MHATSKSFVKEMSELNAPIVLFAERGKCESYSVLKDVQFYKAIEPWRAYQELSMFLGNIAAPDRVPVVVSDKDRLQQHGFDKWSFRKPPQS